MERRRGLIVQVQTSGAIGDDLDLRRRLSESVVDTLVALHDVDIRGDRHRADRQAGRFRHSTGAWLGRSLAAFENWRTV